MKIRIIILILLCLGFVAYVVSQKGSSFTQQKPVITPTQTQPTPTKKPIVYKKSLFVPYWSITKNSDSIDFEEFNRLLYFGISPTLNGINTYEQGYVMLSEFVRLAKGVKPVSLVLRMTDQEQALTILADPRMQERIIKESITIAKENSIDAIALDLEITNPFSSKITGQITDFVQLMYNNTKAQSIGLSLIMYGDVQYRKRGYDLQALSAICDDVFIMAYDFHKAGGEPGPNFPLDKGLLYGYDLKTMLSDFKTSFSEERITVIFGMYGYDWNVDEKKRPIQPAKALTLKEIQKQFLTKCVWKDCIVKRDELSAETEVNYVYSVIRDGIGYMDFHVAWFEDETSVATKAAYLQTQGVGSIAYWAFGYY